LNKLSSLERPKDIYLSNEPFTAENNILTPTFKLKRNIGRDVYKEVIDDMYNELHKRGM
jgi:long-chain acyl-CoA synthetase